MSPKLRNFILSTLLFFVGVFAYGQSRPPAPGNTRAPGDSLPGLATPIDENVVVLIFVGILMGFVYYYKSRKRTVNQ